MAGDKIRWRHDIDGAREEARQHGKLVLVDLFNPH